VTISLAVSPSMTTATAAITQRALIPGYAVAVTEGRAYCQCDVVILTASMEREMVTE